jgi:hypothetical protein
MPIQLAFLAPNLHFIVVEKIEIFGTLSLMTRKAMQIGMLGDKYKKGEHVL